MRQVWYNTPTCTPTHNHAPTLTLAIVITLTTDSVQLQCYFVGRFTGSLRSPQPTHGGEPSGLLDYRITVWDSHPRCCHRRIVRMSPRGQARPDVPGVPVSTSIPKSLSKRLFAPTTLWTAGPNANPNPNPNHNPKN